MCLGPILPGLSIGNAPYYFVNWEPGETSNNAHNMLGVRNFPSGAHWLCLCLVTSGRWPEKFLCSASDFWGKGDCDIWKLRSSEHINENVSYKSRAESLGAFTSQGTFASLALQSKLFCSLCLELVWSDAHLIFVAWSLTLKVHFFTLTIAVHTIPSFYQQPQ